MIVEWLTCDAMTCFNGCWTKVCACIVHQYQHKKFNGTQLVYLFMTHSRQQQLKVNQHLVPFFFLCFYYCANTY